MILVALERGFVNSVIEPGQQFEVPDDFVIPSWAKKKGRKAKEEAEPAEEPSAGDSVI